MARVSVDGVIASIRKALGTARKSSFSLEDVDDCYRYFAGEPVPYRDCGAASLLELLQKKCDFLTVMKTDGQTVEVVLRPFPYEDARVNRKVRIVLRLF
ncbi:hypothetical protein BIW11_08433 [Tropilaelaps mercedesae]|uniref:HTH OST-type domain-containing protein n=1 Tax=Tropilaelaps mercedesae TaxID=418985 RepID=A0A1V9XPZ6_9ACAR|nr:hypothetical protein BIW11_08433 [Tropilaelaps mercedesae]